MDHRQPKTDLGLPLAVNGRHFLRHSGRAGANTQHRPKG
jgi:hypothetical protein